MQSAGFAFWLQIELLISISSTWCSVQHMSLVDSVCTHMHRTCRLPVTNGSMSIQWWLCNDVVCVILPITWWQLRIAALLHSRENQAGWRRKLVANYWKLGTSCNTYVMMNTFWVMTLASSSTLPRKVVLHKLVCCIMAFLGNWHQVMSQTHIPMSA